MEKLNEDALDKKFDDLEREFFERYRSLSSHELFKLGYEQFEDELLKLSLSPTRDPGDVEKKLKRFFEWQHSFKRRIRQDYPYAFKENKTNRDWRIPKWAERPYRTGSGNVVIIAKHLSKGKFVQVVNYLRNNILSWKISREIIHQAGGDFGPENFGEEFGQRMDLIVNPKLDYAGIKKDLGISQKTFDAYVRAMVKAGVAEYLPKRIGGCRGGRRVIKLGQWQVLWNPDYQRKFEKPLWLLKETPEVKEALATFKYPR
jgi:hypothetical protein